jgi:hypothetical protein
MAVVTAGQQRCVAAESASLAVTFADAFAETLADTSGDTFPNRLLTPSRIPLPTPL